MFIVPLCCFTMLPSGGIYSFEYIVCCESLFGTEQHIAATVLRLRSALTEKGRLILMQKSDLFVSKEGLDRFSQQICLLGMIIADMPLYVGPKQMEYVMLSFNRFGDVRLGDSTQNRLKVESKLVYPAFA